MNTCYNTIDANIIDRKKLRKVSKYNDYSHKIAKERTECIYWINKLENEKEYLERVCKIELIKHFKRINSNKYAHRNFDIKNGSFTRCVVESAFNKNKFYVSKEYKTNEVCYFNKYDVYKFMLALIYVLEKNELEQFIDIPDVFYVVRQLKQTNLNFYFKGLKA